MKYIEKNILSSNEDIIVHGCNCQGKMGSGVALAIRNKWPEAYRAYVYKYKNFGLQLGEIQAIPIENGRFIINAMTQEFYGRDGKRYVSYEAIESCMQKISDFMKEYGLHSIAMPPIGSGLGGGDWNIIKEIIKEKLCDFEIFIYNNASTPLENFKV